MPKTIKINQIQEQLLHKHILYEFMQQGFSFEFFKGIGNSSDRYDYCRKYLGEPIGQGSSRITFEIDDAQVLKLAYGHLYNAGVEQNKVEWEINKKVKSPLLTKILYHDDDFSWIISERVLPCTDLDFNRILGLSYFPYSSEDFEDEAYEFGHQNLLGYRDYRINPINKGDKTICYAQVRSVLSKMLKGEEVSQDYPIEHEIITTHPWFKELYRLCSDYNLELGDISRDNCGITLRNGKPYIVILDSGYNSKIGEKYYGL